VKGEKEFVMFYCTVDELQPVISHTNMVYKIYLLQ